MQKVVEHNLTSGLKPRMSHAAVAKNFTGHNPSIALKITLGKSLQGAQNAALHFGHCFVGKGDGQQSFVGILRTGLQDLFEISYSECKGLTTACRGVVEMKRRKMFLSDFHNGRL